MRVGTKDGGDGVRCWNREAVTRYAERVNAREAQVAQANPDVVVLPGRLVCYGCEVMEYDYGIKCTASLTRTRYAVRDETEPRAEDAVGSLQEIEGLRERAPSDVQAQPVAVQQTAPAARPAGATSPAPAAATESKRGLRGLFGR